MDFADEYIDPAIRARMVASKSLEGVIRARMVAITGTGDD
jgi:hypothetical protein